MRYMIINGPNLNMLGIREKQIYGENSYEDLLSFLKQEAEKRNIEIAVFQSNHEGVLVDLIQQAYFENYDGIIINPAAYTHTSVAIADAIKAVAPLKAVEVHLSDIDRREDFRKVSYVTPYCLGQIKGHGFASYSLAMDLLLKNS